MYDYGRIWGLGFRELKCKSEVEESGFCSFLQVRLLVHMLHGMSSTRLNAMLCVMRLQKENGRPHSNDFKSAPVPTGHLQNVSFELNLP